MSRGYSAIGLVAPKSDPNIGGALRAAHCYGAAMVVIQGARYQKQSSDTTKMARHIPLVHAGIFEAMPIGCVPVAVEFISEATPLPIFCHPERAMYIFGPEDGSVPLEILERCAHVLYVPTRYCMNLASTVNVVLYDRLAKSKQSGNVADSEGMELADDQNSDAAECLADIGRTA